MVGTIERSGKPHRDSASEGVASVERALVLLASFEAGTRSSSLAALAERSRLPKSTVLRLVASLISHGYIRVTPDGGYRLGPAVLHLADVYQKTVQPEDVIRPVLQRLAETSGESASLNVRDGDMQVCLYRVDSVHALRDHIRAGQCFALDRGCSAMVLRAASGEAGARFDRIRSKVAISTRGEMFSGTSGIAVPVFELNQALIGALILSGPTSRFTAKAVARMTALLLDAGALLTQELGGNPSLYTVHVAGNGHRRNATAVQA